MILAKIIPITQMTTSPFNIEKAHAFELTYAESVVMDCIERNGGTWSANKIAAEINLDRRACNRAINGLIDRGLLSGTKATRTVPANLTINVIWHNGN